jgi:hypothetical protein
MTVLATDNFDRADNTDLGANWTPRPNSMQILSQKVAAFVAGDDEAEAYTGISWPDDQYVQVAVSGLTTTGGGTGIGVILRCADGNNFYRVVVSGEASNNVSVSKQVATVFTTITNRTTAWSDGDVLKVDVIGDTLRVYKNGVQLGADIAGDGALATGAVGIGYSSTASAARADLFEGGSPDTPGAQNQIAWVRA